MNVAEFLDTVITTPEGYLCILIGPPQGKWFEVFFHWPDEKEKAIEYALTESGKGNNAYFSAHLFANKESTKSNVLPTFTIQADLDDADLNALQILPTVLVRTSPNRHQGYWVLEDELEPKELESLSRRLTYSIEKCDPSGWPLGKRVRLPETLNYKYSTPQRVEVIKEGSKHRASELLAIVSDVPETHSAVLDDGDDWIEEVEKSNPTFNEAAYDMLLKHRDKLTSSSVLYYTRAVEKGKRSEILFHLMVSLFESGASRDEVFYIAKNSANNGFADRKYDADRALAKDVLRAELKANRAKDNVAVKIRAARRSPGSIIDKREAVADVVIEDIQKHGKFLVYEIDNRSWILPNNGKPISITRHSEDLSRLLEVRYGLNESEKETQFVVSKIVSYSQEYGVKAILGSLSYYNTITNSLLVHNGRYQVYRVTENGISVARNGEDGVLFPWNMYATPFYTVGTPYEDWAETVLKDYLHNLTGMTHEEAVALVRVWVTFMLFRTGAQNRPILALFGQPGSGKSTLFRVLYAIIYGTNKAVDSVTNTESFDIAVSRDPFVAYDNVDTAPNWLPDKLALSAANSDMVKRKLYTDADVWVLKRQAMIGVSAHNPKFGREDVVDRMLLMYFNRIERDKRIHEAKMVDDVLKIRDRIWQSLLHDAWTVIKSEKPDNDELPDFRITDFAYYGLWISRALGIENQFLSSLNATRSNQSNFILNEEEVLIDAITRWIDTRPASEANEFYTVQRLFEKINSKSYDQTFQKFYGEGRLGKKLWVAAESLRTQFDIEVKAVSGGKRLWRIGLKRDL